LFVKTGNIQCKHCAPTLKFVYQACNDKEQKVRWYYYYKVTFDSTFISPSTLFSKLIRFFCWSVLGVTDSEQQRCGGRWCRYWLVGMWLPRESKAPFAGIWWSAKDTFERRYEFWSNRFFPNEVFPNTFCRFWNFFPNLFNFCLKWLVLLNLPNLVGLTLRLG